MTFRWVPDADLDQSFEDQHQAEDWLTVFFDDLVAAGITEVSLYDDDQLVYGPMPLSEA